MSGECHRVTTEALGEGQQRELTRMRLVIPADQRTGTRCAFSTSRRSVATAAPSRRDARAGGRGGRGRHKHPTRLGHTVASSAVPASPSWHLGMPRLRRSTSDRTRCGTAMSATRPLARATAARRCARRQAEGTSAGGGDFAQANGHIIPTVPFGRSRGHSVRTIPRHLHITEVRCGCSRLPPSLPPSLSPSLRQLASRGDFRRPAEQRIPAASWRAGRTGAIGREDIHVGNPVDLRGFRVGRMREYLVAPQSLRNSHSWVRACVCLLLAHLAARRAILAGGFVLFCGLLSCDLRFNEPG